MVWVVWVSGQLPFGILGVGANFLNEKYSISVSHKDHQAVIVPADVEDDAVSGKKVRDKLI
jgi:hypothetical protein